MKVFISHSSTDKWVARQLARLIDAEGHTTFLDEKDIKTGDSIDVSIQTHLKDCDHLLLLLSPASIASQWVFIELGGAKALEKRVIPILFHLGANRIPSAISQLLARDLNDFDKYLEELRQGDTSASGSSVRGRPGKARSAAVATKKSERVLRRPADFPLVKSHGGLSKGDRVRIVEVERLTDEDRRAEPQWVSSMNKYSGAQARVVGVDAELGWIVVDVDDGEHWWNPSWLSKLD